MSFQQFLDLFLEFEQEKLLFNNNNNGDYYWHYIRMRVFMDLSISLSLVENPKTSEDITSNIPSFIDSLYGIVRDQKFLFPKDILIIPDRRLYFQNGKYKDIYTHLLCKNLGYSHVVLYYGDANGEKMPIDASNVVYADMDKYLKKHQNIMEPYPRIDKGLFLNEVVYKLEKFFDFNVADNMWQGWMMYMYYCLSQRSAYYSYYDYILNKCNPKVIIITESYSNEKMFLIERAKKRNISVVELQHGYAGLAHFAYNYPQNVKMPNWFPDYFFSFGTIEKSVRFPIDKNNIVPVGFPELESKLAKSKPICNKQKVVLFISEPSIDLADLAIEFEKISEDYLIIYKLHPFEVGKWREIYGTRFSESNIEIIDTMEKTIHDYLRIADWVVGISSTGLYEAMMFDTKVAIYKCKSYEKSKPLYENGAAILINDAKTLKIVIDEDKFIPVNRNNFFEHNSINNMKKKIGEIISKNVNSL